MFKFLLHNLSCQNSERVIQSNMERGLRQGDYHIEIKMRDVLGSLL